MKASRFSVATVGVVTCLATGGAGAALYGFGPAESWTIGQIAATTTTANSNIAAFGAQFGTMMATSYEQMISAIAVTTKQEALGGSVVSDGAKQSAEQLINAVRAQNQSEQIAETFRDYNPAMAQGYSPCLTNARNRTLDAAFDSLGATAKANMTGLDVAPGRMAESAGGAMVHRLATHRTKFCSQEEANAGLCSVSALPGGDTNGALLFEPTDPGSLKAEAQQAYIQHVLGTPDEGIPKDAGRTPAGQNYMLVKNSKDALMSIPAYSLAMVRAANARSAGLGNKSPNEVMRLRVNQYFGGKEAQDWSMKMAAQSERGLMVEAVKMAGLEVWMHHKQYQQNQRLELNLAALSLAAAQDAKGAVDAKYERVMRETAAATIK